MYLYKALTILMIFAEIAILLKEKQTLAVFKAWGKSSKVRESNQA